MSFTLIPETKIEYECLCGSRSQPMVHTGILVPKPLNGHPTRNWVVCAHCVARIADAAGFVRQELVEQLEVELASARARSAELEAQLEAERSLEAKVVPLADVLRAIGEPHPGPVAA